jgi:tetratricopeptide (TPR) repeat protein
MNGAARWAAWLAVFLLSALAAWRILATGMADRLAGEDPLRALQWDARQPRARLMLAQQELDRGQPAAAAEIARQLLAHEPLAGDAWAILAQAAAMQGDRAEATRLFEIARRRAPHAQRPLAWLIEEQLRKGDFAQALENVDRLLRIAPGQHRLVFPPLLQLADQPAFVEALADRLAARPPWRPLLIGALISKGSADTVDRVLSEVQERGGLEAAEIGRWIDRLAATGQWGEAYARWAGELDAESLGRLASVYNGDFESAPSDLGFDWRIDDAPGVIIVREAMAGTGASQAIRLHFLGRRVESIPMHQWLLLAPGSYRLRFSAKAEDLRADRGVQWVLRCQQRGGAELAASEAQQGNFDLQVTTVDFRVPETDCVAQDLFLRNAGAEGPGKILIGSLWFDDVNIERLGR